MDKCAFFVWNIFINSFLTFLTAIALIETVIFLFQIRQGRLAAVLRMLPILKLPLDLFLYNFSNWAYAQGINPLNAPPGSRVLSIMLGSFNPEICKGLIPLSSHIQLTVHETKTFTIADLLSLCMHPYMINAFSVLFLFLSLLLLLRKIHRYRHFTKVLQRVDQFSKPLEITISNPTLLKHLQNKSCRLLTSSTFVHSPFVSGSTIYFPEMLSKSLSQNELEAVLAHELQHIRYKDNWVRFILTIIESLYWWIPTKWLQKRITEGQEVSCDHSCRTYGINPIELASALCKSARNALHPQQLAFVHHLTQPSIHKRVTLLLNTSSTRLKKYRVLFSILSFGVLFFVVFLGRFWIF